LIWASASRNCFR